MLGSKSIVNQIYYWRSPDRGSEILTFPYIPPERDRQAFNCPLCNAYARQDWRDAGYRIHTNQLSTYRLDDLRFAFCEHCGKYTIWSKKNMIFPLINGAPMPHPDLPQNVKDIYEESRSIVSRSPRGSSALLRLAIEILTNDILAENKGKDLSDSIHKLVVERSLPEKIKKGLDILRVTGNNAVHPGQIDFKDNQTIAISLFNYTNMITDYMIKQPREVEEAFNSLPEKDRESIKKRDEKLTHRKSKV